MSITKGRSKLFDKRKAAKKEGIKKRASSEKIFEQIFADLEISVTFAFLF